MQWEKLVCIITEVLVPIFFENLQGINEMKPLEFFLGGGGGGTHLEWRVEGRGMRALSQILSDVSLSYSLKHISTGGALTSHFMQEHSSPTSLFPVFMMTPSNGNMFRVTGFCAGNSPVTGEFPLDRPLTRSFDVFFDLRLNKRLSKQSRRRWFETPLRSLWRHSNVVPNSE